MSYCEFLAVLLPPMEDVFEDASQVSDEVNSPLQPREHWNPSRSVSNYFSQMKRSPSSFFPQALLYDEEKKVSEVVGEMARFHRRWALIRFKDGTFEFFDYMDINHRLLEDAGSNGSAAKSKSWSLGKVFTAFFGGEAIWEDFWRLCLNQIVEQKEEHTAVLTWKRKII